MSISKLKNKVKNSLWYRMLKFRNKPLILEDVYGIRFVLYPWDTMPLEKHLSRRNYVAEFEAMKKIIREGDTVFDVGANIGLHSVLFNRWVGQRGKVYGFEPVPDTFRLYEETLALNGALGITHAQEALSDKIGTATINIFPKEHSVWNSLGNPTFDGIKPTSQAEIKTNTLDNFCKEHSVSHIDFLKIDVEGFEKFVFQGAREMLGKGAVDVLSFEISQIPLAGSGTTAQEVFDIIQSFGYKVYSFNYKTRSFEGPVSDSTAFYDNYFASKDDLRKI